MKIDNFSAFKIGTVFNPLKIDKAVTAVHKRVCIEYPSRLNAMAIDPSKIVENNNMKYTPGEIVFSTQIFISIEVKFIENSDLIVYRGAGDRETVVRHACNIMKKALGYTGGFEVDVQGFHNLKHCGLGSTGCLQAGVATAINHMFGSPITLHRLIKYLAQNYGEEIDNDLENLNPVQCIGGSASSGLHKGGVLVIAGENTVIASADIPEKYQVVIGIPDDFRFVDSKSQFDEEIENLDKFLESGNKYKHEIAYNVLHSFLPAIQEGDLKKMGDVIFDYRFNKGSIRNCSYTYPGLIDLMNELAFLKTEDYVSILSISSVGPTVFAIGEDIRRCEEEFKRCSLRIIKTKINNGTYKVVSADCEY